MKRMLLLTAWLLCACSDDTPRVVVQCQPETPGAKADADASLLDDAQAATGGSGGSSPAPEQDAQVRTLADAALQDASALADSGAEADAASYGTGAVCSECESDADCQQWRVCDTRNNTCQPYTEPVNTLCNNNDGCFMWSATIGMVCLCKVPC